MQRLDRLAVGLRHAPHRLVPARDDSLQPLDVAGQRLEVVGARHWYFRSLNRNGWRSPPRSPAIRAAAHRGSTRPSPTHTPAVTAIPMADWRATFLGSRNSLPRKNRPIDIHH